MPEYVTPVEVLEFVIAAAKAIAAIKPAENAELQTYAVEVRFGCEGEDIPIRIVPNDFASYDIAIGLAKPAERVQGEAGEVAE